MKNHNIIPYLFIRALKEEDFNYIKSKTEILSFNSGEIIFKEGEIANGAYFLKRGEVRILKSKSNAGSVFKEYRRGDFFGYPALFFDKPQPFTAIATKPALLLFTPEECIINVLQHNPETAQLVLSEFTNENGYGPKNYFTFQINNN